MIDYKKIKIKKNCERRVKKGYLWLFSNEIELNKEIPPGEIVQVLSNSNEFIGLGFYNPNSLIAIRIISFDKINFSSEYILKLIQNANQLRKELFKNRNSYRMVFGESDLLPGLIIDKFNNSYSIQTFSLGMEQFLDKIVDILVSHFNAENIILRNDSYLRKTEGLELYKKMIFGNNYIEEIDDGLLKFSVDILNGQKTGTFFDQIENRHKIIPLSENKNVLDLFCNEGGFTLSALKGGASFVKSVDISKQALNNLSNNIKLNNFNSSNVEILEKDVFEFLKETKDERLYDLIILDPPSFTKSKKNVKDALKGYFVINSKAMKLLKESGFLITASCSHHIDDNNFFNIISTAALKNKRQFQIINYSSAAPDHPIHFLMNETKYLKFYILRMLN